MKRFEDLTITDDYMFCQVMKNKRLCKSLLERILGGCIGEIEDIHYQSVVDGSYTGRGVRLDVLVKGEAGRLYDVEMQVRDNKNLGRRMRYYQSQIDVESLSKGKGYDLLPDTYIIFFCLHDYVGAGLPMYTFVNTCREDRGIYLEDGMTRIILNSQAADKEENQGIRAVLEYMNGKSSIGDSLIKELEKEVDMVKQRDELRTEYMSIFARETDIRNEGRAEGRVEGRAEGRAEGRNLLLRESILRMRSMGLQPDAIAMAMGVTREEVDRV